jgi:hypothetical protein
MILRAAQLMNALCKSVSLNIFASLPGSFVSIILAKFWENMAVFNRV